MVEKYFRFRDNGLFVVVSGQALGRAKGPVKVKSAAADYFASLTAGSREGILFSVP